MSSKKLIQLFNTYKTCKNTDYFQMALPESLDFQSEEFENSRVAGRSESEIMDNLFLFYDFDHYCFPKLSSARPFNYEFKSLWNLIYKKYYQHHQLSDGHATELSILYAEYHGYLHNAFLDLNEPLPVPGGLDDTSPLESMSLSHRARFLHFQIFCDPIYRFKLRFILKRSSGDYDSDFLPHQPLYQYANGVIEIASYYESLYGSLYDFSPDPHTVVFNSSIKNIPEGDEMYRTLEYISDNEAPFRSSADAFIDRHSGVLMEYGSEEPLQENDLVLFQNDSFDVSETYGSGSSLHLGRFKDGYIHYTPSTDFGMAVKAINLSLNDDIRYIYRVDPTKFI